MSQAINHVRNGLIALFLTAALLGCEQRPAETDPPPTTPGQQSDPAPANRQQLGERTGDAADTLGGPGAGDRSNEVIASASSGRARAELTPTSGNSARGTVDFVRAENMMNIDVRLSGLEPGAHAIHIHEFGDCSAADGSSAGEHFTPEGDPHGAPSDPPEAHHLGDLGNIEADAGGTAEQDTQDEELQLTGEFGVINRAVIVHVSEDDLMSQPSGNSGDPVACGVVRPATESVDRV